MRRLILFLTVLSLSVSAFAQDNLADIYDELDKAFASHSSAAVAAVLKTNVKSPSYELVENYTLKKTRQLIIRNDLEFARQTSLALIDNNIENFDAIDLYAYIDKAIIGEEQKKLAEEEQKQRELARQAALKERAKQQIQSRGNYQTVSSSDGKSGYINDQQITYSPLVWTIKLGLVDFLFQKATEPDYTSAKYGLAFGADIFYPTENFVFGLDLLGDFHLLSLSGEGEIMYSGRAVPQFAISPLSENLFLRLGFAAYPLSSKDRAITGSVDSFMTPVAGLGIQNVSIGETRLGAHADYYAGHLMNEDVDFAMEVGASILLPMNVNEKTKIGIELGVSDVLLMKNEEGMDNRLKGIFAIGVGSVNK